jgi:hypothetical protein
MCFSPVSCANAHSPSAALENLLPRVEKAKERSAASGHLEEEFTMELVISLVQSALDCRGNLLPIFHSDSTALIVRQPSQRIKSGGSSSFRRLIHYLCPIAACLSCRTPILLPVVDLADRGRLLVLRNATTLRCITTLISKC